VAVPLSCNNSNLFTH